jgi:hypothetical protein
VWTAYRAPKLEYEQLPPLADYDRASHLKERSFDKLDPLRQEKRRYFFWGLMAVFWREYVVMCITVAIYVGVSCWVDVIEYSQKSRD